MKGFFYAIIIIATAFGCHRAEAADGDLFPYPVPPEESVVLQERCDFLVTHFWERCNFKSAFSSMGKFNNCFGDWLSFMPYASADTVHASIDRFLDNFKKSGPEMLKIAHMAENWLYVDSAEYFSEDIYLPFAKAAASNKKIPNDERRHYAAQVTRMVNSMLGATVPAIALTARDGSTTALSTDSIPNTLLMFISPECDECALTRVRLSIDYNTNELIRKGVLKIYAIYAGTPDADWEAKAAEYPDNWTVAAAPDATTYFDLRKSPELIILDDKSRVAAKSVPLDNLLNAFQIINTRQ